MILNRMVQLLVALSLLVLAACDSGPETREAEAIRLALTPAQLHWVGAQIFRNECASRRECLVHWNEGEAFPSLGIGHFIWYPTGVHGKFVESFPPLIQFMEEHDAPIPEWLKSLDPFDAPWPDRATFLQVDPDSRTEQLRDFLSQTRGLQAAFIFQRTRLALGRVLQAAPSSEKPRLRKALVELSATPGGAYALMDYVNFKGEGLAESERYHGEGWGLLQVLLEMHSNPEQTALSAFREAAGRVLTRRAENAPRAIERERWLPGWLKRLDTYREPPASGSS